MRAVGEAMAIGRTFVESFQKALRSLETGRAGWCFDGKENLSIKREEMDNLLRVPTPEHTLYVAQAFRLGMSVSEIYELSKYDPWFLFKLKEIYNMAQDISTLKGIDEMDIDIMFRAKSFGFSDQQLAYLFVRYNLHLGQ